MIRLKYILLIGMLLNSYLIMSQDLNNVEVTKNDIELKRNFVLLIDRSIKAEKVFASIGEELLENYVPKVIENAGYEQGDYFSIVTFGLSSQDWKVNDFIYGNQKFLLKEESPKISLAKYYNNVINKDSNYFSKTESYASLSIIMATKEFGTKDIEVDETVFIVLSPNISEVSISDEVNQLLNTNFKGRDEIIDFYKIFTQNYTIETISNDFKDNINISVKKLHPLSNVAPNSVVKFTNINGDNTLYYEYKNGKYLIPVKFKVNNKNNRLILKHIKFSLIEENQLVSEVTLSSFENNEFHMISDSNPDHMTLVIETLLKFDETFYSRQLISYRTEEELKYKVKITKDKSKKILGIFNFSESMMKISNSLGAGSSLESNILWWNIIFIIGILLIALSILILYIRAKGKNKDSKSIQIK